MKEYINLFCSFFKIGLFTFGGGYSMLPMLKKEVVEKHKWATELELLDYFAIGHCTPGIIAVNTATFVGYKHKRYLGSIVATLGIIIPSVIIIMLIANVLSLVIEYPIVQKALEGIRVAVIGLVLYAIFGLWKNSCKNTVTTMISIISAVSMIFLKLSPVLLIAIGIVLGLGRELIRKKK